MSVTALILGFKSMPEISFHDALAVFYLLYISWITVFIFLPSNTRFPGNLVVRESSAATPSAILTLIFRPFSALKIGRILFLVMTTLASVIHIALIVKDLKTPVAKQWARVRRRVSEKIPDIDNDPAIPAPVEPHPTLNTPATAPSNQPPTAPPKKNYPKRKWEDQSYDLQIDWNLVGKIIVGLILWSLAVMNTELLIRWNHFMESDENHSPWQFGQVLLMLLVLPSLASFLSTFMENGLRKLPPKIIQPATIIALAAGPYAPAQRRRQSACACDIYKRPTGGVSEFGAKRQSARGDPSLHHAAGVFMHLRRQQLRAPALCPRFRDLPEVSLKPPYFQGEEKRTAPTRLWHAKLYRAAGISTRLQRRISSDNPIRLRYTQTSAAAVSQPRHAGNASGALHASRGGWDNLTFRNASKLTGGTESLGRDTAETVSNASKRPGDVLRRIRGETPFQKKSPQAGSDAGENRRRSIKTPRSDAGNHGCACGRTLETACGPTQEQTAAGA
ncbi:hypothetical protein C8R43DRAFT_1130235 [Mycena crocata]|nr:hypothetical protein C8R43DRAFT_1130235 [Mycena crocata]